MSAFSQLWENFANGIQLSVQSPPKTLAVVEKINKSFLYFCQDKICTFFCRTHLFPLPHRTKRLKTCEIFSGNDNVFFRIPLKASHKLFMKYEYAWYPVFIYFVTIFNALWNNTSWSKYTSHFNDYWHNYI